MDNHDEIREEEFIEQYRDSGEADIDVERARRIQRGIMLTRPHLTREFAWDVAATLAASGEFVDEELVNRSLGETAQRGEIRVTPDRPRIYGKR